MTVRMLLVVMHIIVCPELADPSSGVGGVAMISLPSTATTKLSFSVTNISLQNGQVVAVGTEYDTTYKSSGVEQSNTSNLAVVRLNTDGSIDTTFGSS